jgi:hypothetical protein
MCTQEAAQGRCLQGSGQWSRRSCQCSCMHLKTSALIPSCMCSHEQRAQGRCQGSGQWSRLSCQCSLHAPQDIRADTLPHVQPQEYARPVPAAAVNGHMSMFLHAPQDTALIPRPCSQEQCARPVSRQRSMVTFVNVPACTLKISALDSSRMCTQEQRKAGVSSGQYQDLAVNVPACTPRHPR